MDFVIKDVENVLIAFVEACPQEALWGGLAGFLMVLLLIRLIRHFRKRKPDDATTVGMAGGETVPLEASKPSAFPEKIGDVPETEAAVEPPEDVYPDAMRREALEAEDEAAVIEPELVVEEPVGLFKRLKSGLSKTRSTLSSGMDKIFTAGRAVDEDLLEEIEELLITADIGVQTTMMLTERIRKRASKISDVASLKDALKAEILSAIEESRMQPDRDWQQKPHVIMVVGVNGVGKTTTIGKLAARFSKKGKSVLIVAADTFRAAAIEQLSVWAERSGAGIVKHRENSDPAAVAYDGIEAATARGVDVVLVDTAGRLHTKVNLMEELKKIKRTIANKMNGAPHEILMVLDATTGQNALTQAKMFHEALTLDSIALTKLDGTAKGGIVIGICSSFKIPLNYIGVGEQIADLQDFDAQQFVDALF